MQQYEEHLKFNAEEEAILVDLMADEESVLELQSILGSKDSLTPRQQALRVARQDMHIMQIRPNDIERFRILHTLSVALGASRTEASTIKALHAVLLQPAAARGESGISQCC